MHVAAALGVPVLALFGPTDPQRTGPFGARHRVLQAPAETCGPCFRDHCRHTQPLCMEYLQPDAVVAAALDMLGRQK
jgi:ADP-heptose:LPS heptosyltransferase